MSLRRGGAVADHEAPASAFAAQVLQKLLWHIAVENADGSAAGRDAYSVLYAWTEGTVLYVVHRAQASDMLWGLARDTRDSLVGPGPWHAADDAARYYLLLDFEEGWAGPLALTSEDDPGVIRWRGDPLEGLPGRASSIPAVYRYSPPPMPAAEDRRNDAAAGGEPRRYADPR